MNRNATLKSVPDGMALANSTASNQVIRRVCQPDPVGPDMMLQATGASNNGAMPVRAALYQVRFWKPTSPKTILFPALTGHKTILVGLAFSSNPTK